MFQVMSVLPFSAKNAFCDSVSFGITPSSVKKLCAVCKLGSSRPFVYFLHCEREQEVRKCIDPKHIRDSGIKISNVVTKETSQILLQTLWHLQKSQISLDSL